MTNIYTTDSNGCATLSFMNKYPKWYNPCDGWDCWPYGNPDVYCKITKPGMYKVFTNTFEDADQDNQINFGTVMMYKHRTGPGESNGCSPDLGLSVINTSFLPFFGDQCNNLDYCYNTCSETKQNCDLEFRDMLYSECNDVWDLSDKSPCKSVASQMFDLVRQFGDLSYWAARVRMGCTN
jgi:Group XII secretory phospholipase A2 precursor (PLA2G12)